MMKIELFILSGFLGSGKTSLLLEHLKQADTRDTAVIVNEVGQINIDGAVIVADASVPAIQLSNGCICCSLVHDLQTTITSLQADRIARGEKPLRRIVLECSGLSRPGPIIRSLQRLPGLVLDVRVIATFDAINGHRSLAEHDEVAAQLAAADVLVMTKLDLADAIDRQAAAATLRSVNPWALLIDEESVALRAKRAFRVISHEKRSSSPTLGILPPLTRGAETAAVREHAEISTFLITLETRMDWESISLWLDDLASFCGDRLLRLKGMVHPTDCNHAVLIQSVGAVFSTPRPLPLQALETLGVVLITRGLNASELAAVDERTLTKIQDWREVRTPLSRSSASISAR
ncbi:CobW family GTP-binding protein [Ottowia thiooxydans]|uniref:G3E family GTPase n=1 Tax=Ottowia thiooxydans TaxID=219182 RepID=A0ABV2QFM1_9BURK